VGQPNWALPISFKRHDRKYLYRLATLLFISFLAVFAVMRIAHSQTSLPNPNPSFLPHHPFPGLKTMPRESIYEVTGVAPNDVLNLRTGPSTTYAIRDRLPNGTLLRSRGACETHEQGLWCPVERMEGTKIPGWVSARYIREHEIAPLTPIFKSNKEDENPMFPEELIIREDLKSALVDCLLDDPDFSDLPPKIQEIANNGTQFVKAVLCGFIKGSFEHTPKLQSVEFAKKSKRINLASELLLHWTISFKYCIRKIEYIKELSPGAALAVREFCKRGNKFEPEEAKLTLSIWRSWSWEAWISKVKKFIEELEFLRGEIFCVYSSEMASPGGIRGVVIPEGETIKHMRGRADALCDQVRSGAISLSDAEYFWQQELVRAERTLGPEMTRGALLKLWDLLMPF
jgi:hypothetical protein